MTASDGPAIICGGGGGGKKFGKLEETSIFRFLLLLLPLMKLPDMYVEFLCASPLFGFCFRKKIFVFRENTCCLPSVPDTV